MLVLGETALQSTTTLSFNGSQTILPIPASGSLQFAPAGQLVLTSRVTLDGQYLIETVEAIGAERLTSPDGNSFIEFDAGQPVFLAGRATNQETGQEVVLVIEDNGNGLYAAREGALESGDLRVTAVTNADPSEISGSFTSVRAGEDIDPDAEIELPSGIDTEGRNEVVWDEEEELDEVLETTDDAADAAAGGDTELDESNGSVPSFFEMSSSQIQQFLNYVLYETFLFSYSGFGDFLNIQFDAYRWPTGIVTITDVPSNSQSQTSLTGEGPQALIVTAPNEEGFYEGGSGDDTLTAAASDDALSAGDGADLLRGLAGADLLWGGRGRDTLDGGSGDDTYVYELEDGFADIIDSAGSDTLAFGFGIYADNVGIIERNGEITLSVYSFNRDGEQGDTGTITFDRGAINTIIFGDGLELNLDEYSSGNFIDARTQYPNADEIRISGDRVWYTGSDDDDEVYLDTSQANTGPLTIVSGGAGDDHIRVGPESGGNIGYVRGGQNTAVYGGPGRDELVGSGLVSGGQDNDYIIAAGTIVYNAGDGADIVNGAGLEPTNVIAFGEGIGVEDVFILNQQGGRDVVIAVVPEYTDEEYGDIDGRVVAPYFRTDGKFITEVSDTRLENVVYIRNYLFPHQTTDGTWTFAPPSLLFQDGTQIVGANSIIPGDGTDEQLGGFEASRHWIMGMNGDDSLYGAEFEDVLVGGAGDDDLFGYDGNDNLRGGSGADSIIGGAGNDFTFGGEGNDTIWGREDLDTLSGGEGADSLFGEGGDDELYGEAGDDRLNGMQDNDLLDGGDGRDTLNGGLGDDTINGGAGDDSLLGKEGDDLASAGFGADTIFGEGGADSLYGDGGNDLIFGGEGNDLILGGDDFDDLRGEGGDDEIFGGEGSDMIQGGAGNDVIYGDGAPA